MSSARYRALSQRVKQLEKRFLPKVFSPTGQYSSRRIDMVRAYRLLVHAEIESYLEDQARNSTNDAFHKFQQDAKPRLIVMSLVCHYANQPPSDNKLKALFAVGGNHAANAVHDAVTAFNAAITGNNGIREKDVLRLLLSVGFSSGDIDTTWLVTVDGFGAKRGQTAHTSFRVQQLLDPQTE